MLVTVLVSFGATLVSSPLVRRSMIRNGVLDKPNHRSSHTLVTPRGGGLACLVGVVAALLVGLLLADIHPPWTAVIAAVGLCAVGYRDDRHSLPAIPRLLAQMIAGAAIGSAAGGVWWAVGGTAIVPLVVNVINFMDGINGITGLHVGWWGMIALWAGLLHQTLALAFLGALCIGCALGFLPTNFPGATMFLGDSGSYLFGGLIAAGVIYAGATSGDLVLVAAPLTLYLVDTACTLLRRLRSHAPLMEAHRDHVYQHISGPLGYSHAAVALGMITMSIVITVAWVILPAVGIAAAAGGSIFYLNAVRLMHALSLRTGG